MLTRNNPAISTQQMGAAFLGVLTDYDPQKLPGLIDFPFQPTQRKAIPSLSEFVRQSWHVIEGQNELLWNWHIEAVCQHAEALLLDWMRHRNDPSYQQRAQNLLVNVPPGSMKSRTVSVCLPAWFWLHCPSWRAIFLSANPRVALRDSVYCRDVIESKWYQETFRPDWELRSDQNAKSSFWNTKGGVRSAFGINSKITGDRGDALIVDDPHDAEEVKSDKKREGVLDRWDSAIRNRVSDLRSSVRLGIMQRLHEKDWAGHILQQGEWELLKIPQEYEGDTTATFIGWSDPRTELGELMSPVQFPDVVLAKEKRALGPYGYAGQHQQRPAPAEGGMFNIRCFAFYKEVPGNVRRQLISLDASFKAGKENDPICLDAIAEVRNADDSDYYVLNEVNGRRTFTETVQELVAMSQRYPRAYVKLIEDKANGPAIIDTLKDSVKGVTPYNPGGDSKTSRATSLQPIIERGGILFPLAKWAWPLLGDRATITAAEFWALSAPPSYTAEHLPCDKQWQQTIQQFVLFPNGEHDDPIDSIGQAIRWCESKDDASTRYRAMVS